MTITDTGRTMPSQTTRRERCEDGCPYDAPTGGGGNRVFG
jgi:hypothetical protein